MSFEWQHFLDLAQDLTKQHPVPAAPGDESSSDAQKSGPSEQIAVRALQEAALRTSVSRAYYAAYHLVREYVEMTGRGTPPKGDSHIWVWKQLDAKKRRQEGAIQKKGFTIINSRRAADYDIGITARNWAKEAEFTILTARKIQELIEQIRPQK